MIQKTRLLPREAAAFLGCSYDWLMKEVRRKQIPHYRIGRRVFFTREALTLWIENQERLSVQREPGRLDGILR
jgi:excisionase family DNA binding protein